MSGYSHLTADEKDRLSDLRADGLLLRAIARALGRAASSISREIRRYALASGAYRPHVADGAYMLRRQRQARLEADLRLAAYVTDRLTEGWTPEQIAGRLQLGTERGLGAVCTETIYGWIYRAGQKAGRLAKSKATSEGSTTVPRRANATPVQPQSRVPESCSFAMPYNLLTRMTQATGPENIGP